MSELTEPQRLWVEALESGKHKQTTGYLSITDGKLATKKADGLRTKVIPTGECCLGVLCEVAIEHGVVVQVTEKDGIKSYGGHTADLPQQVKRWAGLVRSDGGYLRPGKAGGLEKSLASDNDEGKSFTTIAQTIRSRPVGLFR